MHARYEGDATGASRRQLSWFLFFRILVTSLFLGGAIFYQLRAGAARPRAVLPALYLLVALSYLQSLISAVILPNCRRTTLFIQSQIAWDLLLAAALIYVTGNIESLFSFLFILIVISSSVFLSRRELLFVASAAAILYGSLLDLQYYGFLPELAGLHFSHNANERDVFYAVFVNVIAFFLSALLSGTLSERLKRSQRALEKKEIDYEDLEKFSAAILSNITSGLLIVNHQARIRSFNRGATRITGYTLEQVYNRQVRELFPGFEIFADHEFRVVSRGESKFKDSQGRTMILGYASSLLKDVKGEETGLLVTFQDLTRLKKVEEQLKRSDRLAAVGRLASGMAHEIRNPLASISGSVQLLMEGRHVTEDDRRLMRIVVKEAERLSNLLTDFLLFARPTPPKIEPSDVSALLDELVDVVRADPRFAAVTIEREYPLGVFADLDRHQFHQALWNLIINGVESIEGGGRLLLGVDVPHAAIFVEDTGSGIPLAIRSRIFDPFFTMKDKGTGLGLSTVHTIAEAHGAHVEVSEGRDGSGTRFTIRLQGAFRSSP